MSAARKEVLFIQYTNPANYPPLEHASHILAGRGWDVTFLGIIGHPDALRFAPHPRIRVRLLRRLERGWAQKVHFFIYSAWVVASALLRPAAWIYASDPFSTPAALVLARIFGRKVVYHEHDSPSAENRSAFMRVVGACRVRLARAARACVLPNAERARIFTETTGRTSGVSIVWNCPEAKEAASPWKGDGTGDFWLVYQGTIVPERLPVAVVDALGSLPARVKLRVFGFESIGHRGYVARLVSRAKELGISERVQFMGPAPRTVFLESGRRSHVGLAFMPAVSDDGNVRYALGASNKPFEYLACGMPLLVTDQEGLKKLYVDGGFGLACDPEDPESVAAALRRFIERPEEAKAMGERGRLKVASDWNYEKQFEPVLRILEGVDAGGH